jgi:putative addiction module component (TIGR02574 family)
VASAGLPRRRGGGLDGRVRVRAGGALALLREALKLPSRERAQVAEELLASLDDEPIADATELEKAWGAEIERRARRVLAGESPGVPWETIRREVEGRLAKQ